MLFLKQPDCFSGSLAEFLKYALVVRPLVAQDLLMAAILPPGLLD